MGNQKGSRNMNNTHKNWLLIENKEIKMKKKPLKKAQVYKFIWIKREDVHDHLESSFFLLDFELPECSPFKRLRDLWPGLGWLSEEFESDSEPAS